MANEELTIKNLQIEVEALKKSPVYVAYKKFKEEYAEGQDIESIILGKMRRFNMILGQLKAMQEHQQQTQEEVGEDYGSDDPVEDDEEEVPPVVPKRVMPQKQQQQFKQQLQQNRAVPPQREAQLNKKIAAAVPTNPFEAEADELGLNDEIPGLPDDLDKME